MVASNYHKDEGRKPTTATIEYRFPASGLPAEMLKLLLSHVQTQVMLHDEVEGSTTALVRTTCLVQQHRMTSIDT